MNQPNWDELRKLGERLGRQLVNDVTNRVVDSMTKPKPPPAATPPPTRPLADERENARQLLYKLEERNTEIANLQFALRESKLDAERALQEAQRHVHEHDEELRWYRDRYGQATPKLDTLFRRPSPFTDHEKGVVPSTDGEDDPYPRFWRWFQGSTHFYRVDAPDVVYFKFRTTDNWTRSGSMREEDCGPQHEPPLGRDWDHPEDPRNQAPALADLARRPRRFRRAEDDVPADARRARRDEAVRRQELRDRVGVVGHGTDDHSHDGPLFAQLPGDWPRVLEHLVRESDPTSHADWREQLHEALLVTVDDWVADADRANASRTAHRSLRRATGAGPER
jgi:hypothetical protein